MIRCEHEWNDGHEEDHRCGRQTRHGGDHQCMCGAMDANDDPPPVEFDLRAILQAMADHSEANPTHGIGCAHKDEHLHAMSRFIASLPPSLQHEWVRLLGPRMGGWRPTSLPAIEAYNAEHDRRNERAHEARMERDRRQARKDAARLMREEKR